MGLDVTLCCMSPSKCRHCGEPIESFQIGNDICLSGGEWRPMLDGIGYKNHCNGQTIVLAPAQVKYIYETIRDSELYHYGRDAVLGNLARAIVDNTEVTLEADW